MKRSETNRGKGLNRYTGCPTCGGSFAKVAQRRRGGRLRLPGYRFWKGEKINSPSMRVYWEDSGSIVGVRCPDSYHDRTYRPIKRFFYSPKDPEVKEPLEHIEHRVPKELDKKQQKAKRHKERQGKDKR